MNTAHIDRLVMDRLSIGSQSSASTFRCFRRLTALFSRSESPDAAGTLVSPEAPRKYWERFSTLAISPRKLHLASTLTRDPAARDGRLLVSMER
jgi:hypothetical protein